MSLSGKRPQRARRNSSATKTDAKWNRSLASVRIRNSLKVGSDCVRYVSMGYNTVTQ